MNISNMNLNQFVPSMNMPSSGGGGSDELKSLEKKLQNLESEKKKAIESKDEEKRRKIEKEIQQVQQQIQKLKMEQNKQQQKECSEPKKEKDKQDENLGQYVDLYA